MSLLIQKLLEQKIIDRERAGVLEAEVKDKNQKEEEVILESSVIDEKSLFEIKARELKISFREVSVDEISLKVLELIPEDSARFYKMIPLAKKGDILEIGMVYPEDLNNQEALKFLSRQGKWKSQVFLITLTSFNKLLIYLGRQINIVCKFHGFYHLSIMIIKFLKIIKRL